MNEILKTHTSFELIIDNCSEAILLVNRKGEIEYANSSAKLMFNYRNFIGINVSELIPERFRKKHSIIVDSFFQFPSKRKMGDGINLYALKSNGTEFPVEIGINFYEEYGVKKVILSIIDISERVNYELKLKEYYGKLQLSLKETQYQKRLLQQSQEKYKSIVMNMDDVYYRTDLDQIIVYISPSVLRYYGADSIDDVIGLNVVDTFYFNPNDRVMLLEALKAGKGRISNYEIVLKDKLNKPVNFATTSHFVYDENGKICGVEGILRDITEKKNLERIQQQNADKIAQAYEHISDSINYAKTIQLSMLAKHNDLKEYFTDYFVLFEPKDNISGDFYYANQIADVVYFAVGDCTGHGVPGALITMLAINTLHNVIRKNSEPAEILEKLRLKIKEAFSGMGQYNLNGLDIALCAYYKNDSKIIFSGAFLPLLLIRNNDLTVYEPTRNPVGSYLNEIPFESKTIKVEPADKLYLFSDGYHDQFDKENDRKMGKKSFYRLLKDSSRFEMDEQLLLLHTHFYTRKKDKEQTDDVTIMGVQI